MAGLVHSIDCLRSCLWSVSLGALWLRSVEALDLERLGSYEELWERWELGSEYSGTYP